MARMIEMARASDIATTAHGSRALTKNDPLLPAIAKSTVRSASSATRYVAAMPALAMNTGHCGARFSSMNSQKRSATRRSLNMSVKRLTLSDSSVVAMGSRACSS